ncbi:MAG TPA: CPBP family intramembrane glutamic endopeptidase, partial [Labilithrix sp.]|nr:CPBP family intramembrane glutamic endopeptidase [Labilithrix sp.]
YVRSAGEDTARPCEPRELAAEGGSIAADAETLIARDATGPFVPLPVALDRDAVLRDAFARAIPVPSLRAWSRMRWFVLAAAAVPLLMLLELDRELVSKDLLGAGRLLVDLLLAAYVGFELTRRTPRLPGIAGAALIAMGMRWLLVTTRLCGKNVHPAVWVAMTLSVGAGLAVFARAPTRARLSLELLDKLGISRADANAARRPALVPGALVVASAAVAAGLPLLLWALRRSGVALWPQAAAFVVYALAAPEIVRRALDARGRDGAPRTSVGTTLLAIVSGLTITAALLHGTHQFMDAGAELARCTGRLDEASRRLLGAEAAELSRRIASVRASTMLALMTTCVMPLAEERVYRGLLMNVLVRRYGFAYGLFVSSAVFGFAHVGIYEIALYQTVLLGAGFGLAYAEGGLVAAFAVHALWNLLNVA